MSVDWSQRFLSYNPDDPAAKDYKFPPRPFSMGDSNFPNAQNYTKKQPYGHWTWQRETMPVPPPIDDGSPTYPILYKLWRASEKVKRINKESSKLARLGFYEIVTERKTDKLYVTKFSKVRDIPDIIPILTGEAAYHIRSSLCLLYTSDAADE